MMKKLTITFFCLLLFLTSNFAQTRKPTVKPPTKSSVKSSVIKEVSAEDWLEITKSLEAEDWDKTVSLTANFLATLKTENDKKQLARLRYFYLFALAGKVSQGKTTTNELQNIAQTFIGKDFIMLDRNVLSDCSQSLNYVCPIKNDAQTIWVSATNKAFTTIHSRESVKLLQPFNFATNNLKNVFVGGILRKVELNPKKDKVWIMRLNFDNGWVQVVDKK